MSCDRHCATRRQTQPPAPRPQILYHHCIGVGKFYIYDDSSSPPLLSDINDLVQQGIVDYHFGNNGQPS